MQVAAVFAAEAAGVLAAVAVLAFPGAFVDALAAIGAPGAECLVPLRPSVAPWPPTDCW